MELEELERCSINSVFIMGRLDSMKRLENKTLFALESEYGFITYAISGPLRDTIDNFKVGQFMSIEGYVKSEIRYGKVITKLNITRIWDMCSFRIKSNTLEITGELRWLEWLSFNSAKIVVATNVKGCYSTIPIYIPDATTFILRLHERISIRGHVENGIPISLKKRGPMLYIGDIQFDNIIYN